ncbi:hypothetical protein GCM10010313_34200 [Streptomyces violarus]|uniref:Uncharacterized protein n=1 Tax=Streptomyces violarus TaxID=67380 RepID=A0A7W4ZP81_9ACTN|nr:MULTISPECIES: hypothetical protein [Streptomyces]MBB3076137.1 hypothetical protein [Streptomyces violarus]WRT98964.1 hypothetical protein VJ737_15245 [Streptomyces sp. CGMCC 4.1772]GHD11257.1 hypothetical protein GCM10010313_34200 [Streptomyces violarus]
MRTNTPAKPQPDTGPATAPRRREPAPPHEPPPAETGVFAPRVRGRHRKPRSRKVLLAAGGLALAAGALSLVRLAPGPSPDRVGTVEAEPRPDPVTTGTDQATGTTATFPAAPETSPSSPTVLGGPPPSPVTRGARPAPPAPAYTRGATTTAAHRPTAIPDRPSTPAPATRGNAPRPAPAAPAPPSRTTPAPAPKPEQPKKPDDPGLCVPVIGLCVDTPGRRG